MMQDIVADSYDAVPVALENRILPALSETDAKILRIDERHWLTSLMAMATHILSQCVVVVLRQEHWIWFLVQTV